MRREGRANIFLLSGVIVNDWGNDAQKDVNIEKR